MDRLWLGIALFVALGVYGTLPVVAAPSDAVSSPSPLPAELDTQPKMLRQFAAAQPAVRPQQRSYMRFEPSVIIDATGFERPMGAATIFLPYGWRSQGGVIWARDYMCTNGYAFNWSSTSPDGSTRVSILPQSSWELNSTGTGGSRPGCMIMQITSVRDYLQALVANFAPGARILDYRNRPDLVAEVGVRPSRTPMPMGEAQIWAEGGGIFYAFMDKGREMRGSISAVVQFNKMITDLGAMFRNDPTAVGSPYGNQPTMQSLTAYAYPAYAATAPNGQFNMIFFEALRKTIKPNPQWVGRVTNHNVANGQVALEENRKRSEMIMQSNNEISRIRQETWNAQQESADRRARDFGDLLRGVTNYTDPNAPGGTVGLQTNGNNSWRLSDGSYVMSSDPNFDPGRDLRIDGQRLEAVR